MPIPNNPVSASQLISLQVGEAQTGGVTAAADRPRAAAGSVARAALASVAAARAALSTHANGSATGATAIPRIALHRLGHDSTAVSAAASTAVSAAVSAIPGAVKPPFVPESDNDTLGIIAGYLQQEDQLVMRNIDASIRAVVDSTIHTLKLDSRDACVVLSEPNALHNLRELHVTECTDEALIELAAKLAEMPKTDFTLIVQSKPFFNHVSVNGIRPLLALHLSGLMLKNIPVPLEMSRALAHSIAPLSIYLPYVLDKNSNVYEISQLPALRLLSVGHQAVTPAAIEALRWHPALEKLHIHTLVGSDVCTLATSADIHTLSIAKIRDGEAAALRALADNNVLTSLGVGVDYADSLSALSQNGTLKQLRLSVRDLSPSVLPALARMPALENFELSCERTQALAIGVGDIQALCTKPLKSLSFNGFTLADAARKLLATAQTNSLQVQLCTPFESTDLAVLSQNRSITSLLIQPGSGAIDNYRDVMALVTSTRLHLASLSIRVGSRTPESDKDALQTAWITSGRQLSNLELEVFLV